MSPGVNSDFRLNLRPMSKQPTSVDQSFPPLTRPIAELKPYPGNARRGNVEAIKRSLEVNGQYRPIVVNRRTDQVLAGNHTLLAAKELGWTEIAVTYVDVDEEGARRIVLADNRTNDLATYDDGDLAALLGDLEDFDGTGFAQEDLDALLDDLEGRPDPAEEEDPPPPPSEPRSRPGDLYVLGRHRLICGDARDPAVYARLLGEERVDLLWTDPPYGVNYEGKTSEALRIDGDTETGLRDLLDGAFGFADLVMKRGARIYVCHPSGGRSLAFIEAFVARGWLLRQQLVWVKDTLVLGHSDYHWRHEPILYGNRPGRGRIGRGGTGWYGDDAQTTVLEVARPTASREHPTMKPTALIEICLRNSTSRSHLVLDPFAGSGSTLIACEQTGRGARCIEIDPGYCDVIVARFEAGGGEAVLQRDS